MKKSFSDKQKLKELTFVMGILIQSRAIQKTKTKKTKKTKQKNISEIIKFKVNIHDFGFLLLIA